MIPLGLGCPLTRAPPQIFHLYTALNDEQSSSTSTAHGGLGFIDSSSAVIELGFTLEPPPLPGSPLGPGTTSRRPGRRVKAARRETVTVSARIAQDVHALRYRPGDTGSVVWRASVLFSEFLWSSHLFPPSVPSFLDPNLLSASDSTTTAKILELGAGTGCLAMLCKNLVGSSMKWTLSDQCDALKLIRKTLVMNDVDPNASHARFEIEEVDWVEVASRKRRPNKEDGAEGYDVILAVDCLFNESLVLPFLHTIDHFARPPPTAGESAPRPATLVVIVSELRSSEVMRLFVSEWLGLGGWTVVRMPREALGKERGLGLASPKYVVWCGWKTASDR